MGYRIRYEVQRRRLWRWVPAVTAGMLVLAAVGLRPEEGWYLALARMVGGLIHGAH